MDLEEIEGIRAEIRKITEPREINVTEARASLLTLKDRYDALLQEKGKEYCDKNCPDLPININHLITDLKSYHVSFE
jgi:hypothetical protein